MKKLIVSLLLLLFSFLLAGGQTYTLDECIERALEHSRALEQAGLSVELAKQAHSQAALAFLPELSVRNSHTWAHGHDELTSVEATALLLGGGRIQSLKKSKFAIESSRLEMELVSIELCVDVVSKYLKLLQAKELMAMNESRLSLLEAQMELVSKKVSLQAGVRSDITMVQADITAAKVELLHAEGDFNSGRINLCQLLEFDDWQAFDVSQPDSIVSVRHDYTVESLPQMQLSDLQSDMADADIGIAKASLWPTVTFSAGIQDKDRYLGLSIDIPILSLLSQAKVVRMKRLSYNMALSQSYETRLSLESELKSAFADLDNAYDMYRLLESEQERYEEIVADVRRKYELGAATYFDCQTAMSGMYQAQARMLQSKYEYLLRMKVLQILYGR